jgi:hypothetical protein
MELSTIVGPLKQLSFVEMPDEHAAFLDTCFPEFNRLETAEELWRDSRLSLMTTSTNALPVQFGRLRRFAGSPTFGQGRYWSVCVDQYGRDERTLIGELMSYWNPSRGYLVDVRDSGIRVTRDDGTTELVRALEVVADRFGRKGVFRRRVGRIDRQYLALRLSLFTGTIDRVVDLRMPATQRWFFETFVALENARQEHRSRPSFPVVPVIAMKTRRLRSFADLLPTLVMDAGGGGIFHQAVGAWLRSHDVNGLVYPSARRDAMMRSVDDVGSEVTFDGWNFVDYRGAAPADDWEDLFGLQPQWLRPDQIGITVERSEDPLGWEIAGAEDREWDKYESSRQLFPAVDD